MHTAWDTFLDAARHQQAAYIGVHMDRNTFDEMLHIDPVRRSFVIAWGDDCLTASVDEVRSWLSEIEEHNYYG